MYLRDTVDLDWHRCHRMRHGCSHKGVVAVADLHSPQDCTPGKIVVIVAHKRARHTLDPRWAVVESSYLKDMTAAGHMVHFAGCLEGSDHLVEGCMARSHSRHRSIHCLDLLT